ncbi:hypothetical protein JHK85_055095 [Glycine max]|nr:hypothetical protein JHK85_055095 [Glycine max]
MRSSIIFLCILVYLNVVAAELSAYDVLEKYDLPVGLLPKGATGIESYELKYKSTIKGVISKGKLSKLKGVSVKIEVLWLKIVELTRDGDDLQFSVGVASAGFSVDSFSESPQCGCGFACDNFNQNGDVSSL